MPRAERPLVIRVEPGKSPECYREAVAPPEAQEGQSVVVGSSYAVGARHEVASMQHWLDLNA